MCKAAFERLLNSVHETNIVFEEISNINGDILQKAWGLNIGEDGISGCDCPFISPSVDQQVILLVRLRLNIQ